MAFPEDDQFVSDTSEQVVRIGNNLIGTVEGEPALIAGSALMATLSWVRDVCGENPDFDTAEFDRTVQDAIDRMILGEGEYGTRNGGK